MEPRVLVPLDGSAFSEGVLETAEKTAKAFGYEMVIFRVIDTPLEYTQSLDSEPDDVKRAADASIEKATAYLKGIASRIEKKGIKTRIEVGAGYPHSAILKMADKEDVELIIMSTHGRTGLARVLVGSVAEKVLHATAHPVLLVKPEKIHQTRTDEGIAILSARG
jgi:nucleotide-binding universal stress UspA family protein